MTHDFKEYRTQKGMSPTTVLLDVRIMNQVLSFINHKYQKKIEPHEIRPIDIKDFLDAEVAKGHKRTTIRLKLYTIRQWFNFMWETGKIQYDFMPKFNYDDKMPEKINNELTIDYPKLLEMKPKYLADKNQSLIARLLLIFYLRGLRLRDVLALTVSDFIDRGDSIELRLVTKQDKDVTILFEEQEENSVLLGAIERAVFRDIPYIFNMKSQKGEYVQMTYEHMGKYNGILSTYFNMRLGSQDLRIVYVHNLYYVQGKSLEEISTMTGISLITLPMILKTALERIGQSDYTNQETI